jgi:hypothetical protein
LERRLYSIPRRQDVQINIVSDNSDPVVNFSGLRRPHTEAIFTKKEKGAGHARNIGLERAAGRLLLFAGADDFFNYCIHDILDTYKNAGVGEAFLENNIRFDETTKHEDVSFSYLTGFYASKIKLDGRALYCITSSHSSLTYNGFTSTRHLEDIDVFCFQYIIIFSITAIKATLKTITRLKKNDTPYTIRFDLLIFLEARGISKDVAFRNATHIVILEPFPKLNFEDGNLMFRRKKWILAVFPKTNSNIARVLETTH